MPFTYQQAPAGQQVDPRYWTWNPYLGQYEPTAEYLQLQQTGDPSLGTDVVYPYGGGTEHFNPSATPVTTFLNAGSNYGPSGIKSTNDPNLIADLMNDARVRGNQGILKIGALVGGGAALGATPWSTGSGNALLTGGGSTSATDIALGSSGGGTGGTLAGLGGGGGTALNTGIANAVNAGTAGLSTVGAGSAAAGGGNIIASLFGGGGGGMAGSVPWLQIAGSLGSTLLGGIFGKQAAGAQSDANNAAIAEQRDQFNKILELTAPQRNTSNAALSAIAGLLGLPGGDAGAGSTAFNAIRGLPGTELAVNDTMRSLRQGGAATGSTGGNVLQALTDRITGLTGDRVYNSLFSLAGLGANATGTAASAASNTGANIGNLLSATGTSNASSILGQGQTLNNSLQALLQYLQVNRGGGGGYPPQGMYQPNVLGVIS